MKLTNLTPTMAVLVTAAFIIGVGVLKQLGLVDADTVSTAITFILGGGSGAALAGGFSPGDRS